MQQISADFLQSVDSLNKPEIAFKDDDFAYQEPPGTQHLLVVDEQCDR